MSSPDLVLLHSPSVYDFRQKAILYGPVSDVIPSFPVFDMYPIGFASIADYLESAGYQVRIVNLAVRMLHDRGFDAEEKIKGLNSPLFGIDLHWLVHAHGAIEVARLVKKCHPGAKVVVGGFSSTYFHKELIQRPEIDYVMMGDSTEEPLRQLVDCMKRGVEPETVPNLAWRDSRGEIRENPFSNVPTDIDNVMVNHYWNIVRSVLRYRDLASYVPFHGWLDYPITAVFTCRGCTRDCVTCGGSATAFRSFYNRPGGVVFRSPQAVFRDIKQIARYVNGPIFLIGDIRQPGEEYGYEVLRRIGQAGLKNQFILELFTPASGEFLRRVSSACPRFCLQISPDSHDPEVRSASGKHYSNQDLEQTLADALSAGCGRLDVFFIIGLPKQTPQSVMDNVDYCDYLLRKFGGEGRLSLFIAPLAPFLDPGSLGFEQPERYGYRILFRTFEEHRRALLAPSWKYTLNYETEWMTRQQIVDTTYEAILRLTRLKAGYGFISTEAADLAERRILAGREMMKRIDDILSGSDDPEPELASLKGEIERINMLPVSEKAELKLPVGSIKLKSWRALWSWAWDGK